MAVLTAVALVGVSPARVLAAPEAVAGDDRPVVTLGASHLPGDLAERDASRLQSAFGEGLERAGFSVQGDATRSVVLSVEREHSDYRVLAQVTDEDGSVVASAEASCDLCGLAELDETVRAVAGRLRQRVDLAQEGAVIEVATEPTGATIHVDGEIVGVSPVTAKIAPGSHEIEAELTGYRSESRDFETTGGSVDHFSLSLRRPRYRTWVPWVLLGGGVAMVGTAAALLAIDDKEIHRDCNADVQGTCQYLHDTRAGGAATMVVGIGLVAAGVITAIAWRRPRSESKQRARVVPGGIAVRF